VCVGGGSDALDTMNWVLWTGFCGTRVTHGVPRVTRCERRAMAGPEGAGEARDALDSMHCSRCCRQQSARQRATRFDVVVAMSHRVVPVMRCGMLTACLARGGEKWGT